MPDADSGDVFLRHRGAILDALLADPAFGLREPPPEPSGTAEAGDLSVGVDAFGEQPPAPAPEDPTPSVLGSSAEPAGADPVAAEPDSAPAPVRPRRSTAGVSASERINALLSGQPMDPGPASSFAAENAERAASRLNATEEPEPERPATPEPARAPRQTPQEMAREVADQLRKPRVALAVAAVVALLIVVLLVVTGGNEETNNQALAVTQAPAQPAPPPAEQPSSGTLEVKAAESSCPSGGTDGMDAFSGEPDKAWSCPRAYKLDGQVLRIDLGKEYEIDSIAIVPGWDHVGTDGTDQWTKFRTVSRVSYQFDDEDKTTYTQETLDQRSLVVTRIEPPVKASEIVLTVLKSAGSSSANAVAISSIVITGQ
ncbi:discoidin domain-containing protein [Nocardia sp. CA-290969]|uniref:discoidin domain-containing protein n=1 Tax=Nocardia sp. CA-290969 TaxID=3239986 RepID=UPI003D936473